MVSYRRQRGSFSLSIVFFFIITVINSLKFSDGHWADSAGGIKFQLIHRNDLMPRNGASQPAVSRQLEHLGRLVQNGVVRLRGISEKVRLKQGSRRHVLEEKNTTYFPACINGSRSGPHHSNNASAELPVSSGADYGAGQYFVQFRVGSPGQKVVLVADTGSDLTWMNCRYRCRGGGCRRSADRRRRVFNSDRSGSFRTVPCSSSTCKIDLANLFSLTRCPSPRDPCAYDYRYSDGSFSQGLFANETVTFKLTNGRKTKLHNVLIGCSQSSRGQSFQAADGVIGLGYSNYSFALKASHKFGGKFSYCLVDHLSPKNKSSYLIFGSHQEEQVSIPLNRSLRYTELVLGVLNPFYAVNIKGISIDETMLEIPSETWNVNGLGGAIVDSGTSLTVLTQPAYQPVMAALRLSLVSFRNLNLDIVPLEYCFNATGFNESRVPRLVFHFADGARFEPPVKSYVIDAAPAVKCVGFVAAPWPGPSVIGNIMQQNHLWEFDLANGRLGFASSSCA